MDVLFQVVTLFLLMTAGFATMKLKVIDERGLNGLNTVILYFAMPSLVLGKLQTPASPELIGQLCLVFVLSFTAMALAGAMGFLLFKGQERKRRAVLVNLCMVSNCAYMGYPIIEAAYGGEALLYTVVYVAAFNLVVWTLCSFVFAGAKEVKPKKLFTNPTLLAVFGGTILLLTGVRLPVFVNSALDMLGGTTTPLAMFVIGARLVTFRPKHLTDKPLLIMCALRLLILPLALLLLRLTPISDTVVKALVLCTAMPCAASTAIQSEAYESDSGLASRGVAVSTLMSLITIPLIQSII